jgi:biopolymer transport protein TolQ
MMGLLAQASQPVVEPLAKDDQSVLSLILHANTVVQFTLLLLLIFSVVCWGIIGNKHRQLKNAKKRASKFYQSFWHSKSIDAMVNRGGFKKSPAFSVFKAGVDALRENSEPEGRMIVEKDIRRAAEDEIESMEYGVPFLATTGSAAPFIGLFGTVWGILHAFWQIGKTGASSLAIVGPHIAEALIATALGLAAAIPAVIFYNFYVNKIRILSKDLWDFSDDLMHRIQNEYYTK